MRDQGPAEQKRAGDIRVHDLTPFVEREVGDRLAQVDPGIVDQDLHFAEFLHDILFNSAHLLFVCHVGLEHLGLSTPFADGAGGFVQLFEIARDQRESGA